jgi:hypothetical protein
VTNGVTNDETGATERQASRHDRGVRAAIRLADEPPAVLVAELKRDYVRRQL